MENFLVPDYASSAINRLLPSLASQLGVSGELNSLNLPNAAHYQVLLIDGLGFDQLQAHAALAPFLTSLINDFAVASCGVPSTTASSITALGTGLVTGQHGIVGYTCREPDTKKLFNSLTWDDAVDPLQWQPNPTYFAQLSDSGISTRVITKADYQDSGLTRSALRGAQYFIANSAAERLVQLQIPTGDKSLTYLYESSLDHTGHKFGVNSSQWRDQLRTIDSDVQDLAAQLPPDTALVVTSDHGMIDVAERIDIDQFPHLRRGVELVAGEARFRHLYCRDGELEYTKQNWQDFMGERAVVLSKQAAIAAGWFGEVSETVAPRIGDLVVAATGQTGIFSSQDFALECQLVGVHGSLTPAEMRIPILVASG